MAAQSHITASSILPPAATIRWTATRKQAVVLGIEMKLIARDEAQRIYRLSVEELDAWRLAYALHGLKGLETTKLQRNDLRTATRRPPQEPGITTMKGLSDLSGNDGAANQGAAPTSAAGADHGSVEGRS